jgi:hypothetical protein
MGAYFCTLRFARTIVRTPDPRTPPEPTNDTTCVNISAHFGVWKKRTRFFSFVFSGFWGAPGVQLFGTKVERVQLIVPSSVSLLAWARGSAK